MPVAQERRKDENEDSKEIKSPSPSGIYTLDLDKDMEINSKFQGFHGNHSKFMLVTQLVSLISNRIYDSSHNVSVKKDNCK